MRALRRNKRQVHFANWTYRKPNTDEWGNETGEYTDVYDDPVSVLMNISAAKGEVQTNQFGDLQDYDRILFDVTTDIEENARLWVDQHDTTEQHDYIVRRIAKSLNGVSIAIKRVEVSGT